MDDAPYQVPSAIREQLAQCIKESFNAIPSTPGSSALAVVDAVKSCVHSLVLDEIARLNARHSFQNRLPVELWCDVWARLPFIDRLRILDVCAPWRSIARTTPHLWSEIRCYLTIHNLRACRCPSCRNNDASELGGWSASPYRKNATNLDTVRAALTMGRDKPVHLSVDVVPSKPVGHILDELSRVCNPHAARIEEIHWRASEPCTLHQFLYNLPRSRLPSLRRMTVEWLPDIDPRHEPGTYHVHNLSDIIPQTIVLPNLEYLSFERMHVHDSTDNLPPLPALRSLSLLPQYPEVLMSLLRHCPRLTSLTVDFSEAYTLPLTSDNAIAQELHTLIRAARLVALHVRDFNTVEDWAFPAFHLSSAPVLSLQYGKHGDIHVGHRIFGDLRGNIAVACTRVADDYCVRGTDEFECTRALLVAEDIAAPLSRIYDAVLPHKITSLTVDLSLWREVAPVPLGFSVSTITFTIPDRRALAVQIAQPTVAAPFPSLQSVHITSDASRDPPPTMEDIVALTPRLGLPLPLPHTVINRSIARRGQHLPQELSLATSVE